jgi:hypothetical protein
MVVPAATPVTTPVLPTVAIPVDEELHTPPLTVLPRVIVLPTHTLDAPLIVAAYGFTVMTFIV